ncbi:hypothetical protein A2U01_0045529, partial [Trifolium medium]|nr:hypothetical protein [Trifolium medium]
DDDGGNRRQVTGTAKLENLEPERIQEILEA